MKTARDLFLDIISANRRGEAKGIYSVCSANCEVLEACFEQAKSDDTIVLIESTSNQVDQYGGYTGMKPADFVEYVYSIAQNVGFPKNMILLGGDHLGPNPWKDLPAEEAMEKARVLIEEYVKAGYQKIHLDTSMFCDDDKGDRTKPLNNDIVASRSTALCKVAEVAHEKYCPSSPKPIYVIGTEVPIPGGAQEKEDEVHPTSPEHVAKTISMMRRYFVDECGEEVWKRVVGVVVQPGVEFGNDHVLHYNRAKVVGLSRKIMEFDGIVFEAHSTDYQAESNLRSLVEDHFGILKVGPWLTFAYREALFALEGMEIEILGKSNKELSNLSATLDKIMLNHPGYWRKYYIGNERQRAFKRKYSFSDRSRYYWLMKEVDLAREKLLHNLKENTIPLSLLSQFMPSLFYQVCEGTIEADPKQLVKSYIRGVAGVYSRACGLSGKS